MLILDIVISTSAFDGDYNHDGPYDVGNNEYEAFHLYKMMVTMFIVEMMVEIISMRLFDLCMKFRIICFHSFCLSSGATSYFHFVSAQ